MANESPRLQELFTSIGRLIYLWAWLESILDFVLLIIYEKHNGASIEEQMPRALEKKISFIIRAADKIPTLAPFKGFLVKWPGFIRDASDFRHDIIHGFYLDEVPEEGFALQGMRLIRKPASFQKKPFTVSAQKIDEESQKILQLISDGLANSRKLAQADGAQNP